MPGATVLVVEHAAAEGPVRIGEALEAHGHRLEHVRADLGEPIPPSLDGYAGLVVMGGLQDAYSDEGFPSRQAERALLADLDFREALGYDQRGYSGRPFTRLVGTIPVGHLQTLMRDLRYYPFGWFLPEIRLDRVPAPFRNQNPFRIIEVLPPTDLAEGRPGKPRSNT